MTRRRPRSAGKTSHSVVATASRAHCSPEHDGSSFNAHANVVMVPGNEWGVVLLENAENSADEFFGGRRMSAIAFGVTSMLMGKQPLTASSAAGLWIVYGVTFAVIALQVLGIVRSVRRFRTWRTHPQRRPRGRARLENRPRHLGGSDPAVPGTVSADQRADTP